MKFTIQDASTLDPAALADELTTALGSNFGISTTGTEITTNSIEDPDQVAFQAVLDAHIANSVSRNLLKVRNTNRSREYPPLLELIDGLVKQQSTDPAVKHLGNAQAAAYYDKCLEIKMRYP